ncbi:hypothetical protein F4809DRAFT_630205 [Biscogniauxia mediterranea]|nr:hypothetical protein F4809DRAFT_630205 [Biscogniauxia mediterranea]
MADSQQQGGELLKFVVQHKKNPDVDDEAFFKWYKEELMPKVMRLIKKYNIVRYSIFYTPSHFRAPLQDEFHNKLDKPDWTVPDWDATTCYWVHSLDDLRALQADPEWRAKINGMEEPWIAKELNISLGYETIYYEDGVVKNTTVAED